MNSMKRQKDRILKDEVPRSIGAQYATEISGEITPERMKRKEMEPKQKQHPVVDGTGGRRKV